MAGNVINGDQKEKIVEDKGKNDKVIMVRIELDTIS